MAVVAACSRPTGGEPCTLVKPSDGGVAPILESEIIGGRTYLSLGDPGCTSGICLRDPAFVPPAQAKATDPAAGYCSASCGSLGSACSSTDPALKLSCKAVVLDGQALTTLPDGGVGPSGSANWPNFCSE
jgi:hypothetical protein